MDERKHFEAVLNDIAMMYGFSRLRLRDSVKSCMASMKIIKFSTTELTPAQIDRAANLLHTFYHRIEENYLSMAVPRTEWPDLNLVEILTPLKNESNV